VNICLIPVFVFFVFKGWLCGQVVGCMFELIDDFFFTFSDGVVVDELLRWFREWVAVC
jgi:hypothetical protein